VTDERNMEIYRQQVLGIPANMYHPLVYIGGKPNIGEGTYIGAFSEVNAQGAHVRIGTYCDIASFVSINVADSHLYAIGLADAIERRDIHIGDRVFIGTHSAILGGVTIGDHSVVAAGSIVRAGTFPAHSLIFGSPAVCKDGYYESRRHEQPTVME
jgi:acetyltransferase-like isoleucine patch superfamily enzyme